MDFQTLNRRQLQALCKKNKVPANLTNVAMAESLKALDLTSQSGTAQSSIDSLEMAEVTSPRLPPTAGRSTRRTNNPKPAPESVNPTTRTRRTARKAQVNDADATETPAPITQTNRKKGQNASACLNMNSQFNECADEDRKDSMVTPAPLGATSRRRVEESAATRVYSTRRSVRLALKSKVQTSTEAENEGSEGFKKDVAYNDGVENFNELSEITDESEVVSFGKEESEVDSDQKNTATIGENIKTSSYAEEEECTNCETEATMEEEKCDNEEDMTLNVSIEVQGNDGSQDVSISEIEVTVEKSTEEIKPEEGESSKDKAVNFVDNVLESGDNLVADGKNDFYDGINEELNNDTIMGGGSKDVTELNVALADLTLQKATKEADSEFVEILDILVQLNETEANIVESLQLEELEKSAAAAAAAADPVHLDEPSTDFSEQILKSSIGGLGYEYIETKVSHPPETEIPVKPVPSDEHDVDFSEHIPKSGDDVEGLIHSGIPTDGAADPVCLDEPDLDFSEQISKYVLEGLDNQSTESDVVHLEVSDKSALDEPDANFSKQFLKSDLEGLENESTETDVLLEESVESAKLVASDEQVADLSEQILKSGVDVEGSIDSRGIVKPACLASCKNSDSMAAKLTEFSENIESGSELVVMRDDDVKMSAKSVDDDLHDMSMRKLTKMLKEKLEITKKMSKNESVSEASTRKPLQVISENQLVEEAQN